ncbi:glycine betaine ABC transporter substrate-binding protein [Acetohalobium arabaticum]|uniref:Substrate-binding region of ABC-type glycine betaine transport system n=1 Tax=Acetohalobium arabaticum (strain ATCC 49924 / DSM 5501 / Z-7288) TaxID=574087 RepID=D9QUS3_ACEAZ|nr:glycine betaine ABC transporter substrate-binding protein [Acetohalobium arabaticum]ADL11982.1 Substrate-binding region of ABC-type glycine betaine transport system [Acetohalobium arabaticum DSM 5501]
MLQSPQQTSQDESVEQKGKVKIGYVQWASAEASTYVVREVLERMGYEVETPVTQSGPMFQGTANGELDAFVCAWLPNTDKTRWEEYGDELVDLGSNYDSAQIGLVVPEYVKADTIPELKKYADKFNKAIVGIDPGATEMTVIENKTMPKYGLKDWELTSSSGPAMTAELGKAIKNDEWIVVAGWKPHWKWSKWDLKFLEDPELTMGEGEYIKSIGRPEIKEDMPTVAKFLQNYKLTTEQLGSIMLKIQNGMEPKKAAEEFVSNNPEAVNSWVPGDKEVVK